MAAADDGTAAEMTQCGKRTDCHPTTSARSHLSDGVFLGVSQTSCSQKTLEFSIFTRLFRIRPGEPVQSIPYTHFIIIYYAILAYATELSPANSNPNSGPWFDLVPRHREIATVGI
jgi:hypothetical protein